MNKKEKVFNKIENVKIIVLDTNFKIYDKLKIFKNENQNVVECYKKIKILLEYTREKQFNDEEVDILLEMFCEGEIKVCKNIKGYFVVTKGVDETLLCVNPGL